jgi:hypothetical protein
LLKKGSALNSVLSKNPVCADLLRCCASIHNEKARPLSQTIRGCTDIRRFVFVKNAKDPGAEQGGVYLGKVVRWYIGKGTRGCINYVGSGNKIGESDGAVPLMDMPRVIPDDLNFDAYVDRSQEMLYNMGVIPRPQATIQFF